MFVVLVWETSERLSVKPYGPFPTGEAGLTFAMQRFSDKAFLIKALDEAKIEV